MQAVVFDGEEQAFQSVMKGKVSPMSVTASDTSVKELFCIEYRKTEPNQSQRPTRLNVSIAVK